MALSREAREELTRRQAALSGIRNNPNWKAQTEEWERQKARLEKRVMRMALSADGIDQRRCDYARGFIDALDWATGVPEHAEASLITYFKKQGIEIEEEELVG
jgi:hypothetical protein